MNNGKSLLKFLAALVLGIIALWFLYAIVVGSGIGISVYHGGGYEHMGYGFTGAGLAGTTSFILLLLIKLLFVLFVIGLVVGIILAIKNYIFTEEDVKKIKCAFAGQKKEAAKKPCSACGKELDEQWKVCPFCGNEI